jgi:hypothetical protein
VASLPRRARTPSQPPLHRLAGSVGRKVRCFVGEASVGADCEEVWMQQPVERIDITGHLCGL